MTIRAGMPRKKQDHKNRHGETTLPLAKGEAVRLSSAVLLVRPLSVDSLWAGRIG
jgi:hypothetical protein